MFEYDGPIFAANTLAEFREDYASQLPEVQNEKLRELNREVSAVPKLLGGMEVLYVLASEGALLNETAQQALLTTLGVVSRAVAEGQYGGAESRDRAWSFATWAAYKLSPTGNEPIAPEVDPMYSTIPTEATVPVPPVQ